MPQKTVRDSTVFFNIFEKARRIQYKTQRRASNTVLDYCINVHASNTVLYECTNVWECGRIIILFFKKARKYST